MPPKRKRSGSVSFRRYVRQRQGGIRSASRPQFLNARRNRTSGRVGRRRLRRRQRTVRRRGGRRRTTRRRSTAPSRSFRRSLLLAEGQRYRCTRNIQSQFKVPYANSTTVFQEPMAQYMYPRLNVAGEDLGEYYTPMDYHDVNDIVFVAFGNAYWNIQTSMIYETRLLISYDARYQVTNLSNGPVKYQMLEFRVKKGVPTIIPTNGTMGLLNPLNPAGTYNVNTFDGSGDINATNRGLHTERHQIRFNPAWNHWFKQTKQKTFTLSPGALRTDFVRRKRHLYKLIDFYPSVVANNGLRPDPVFARWAGTKFIMYKMLSSPADINDTALPLVATSTRTAPVSLLSYQVNYTMHKPDIAPKTTFAPLESKGYANVAADVDIRFMGDANVAEQEEKNVN